jgi:phosphoglycerate dehydrogenase-like enzyme
VQVASAGVDWFPRWLFEGPVVTCGRGHAASAIAEYVLAALLLHAKRLDAVTVRSADAWSRHTLGTLEGTVLGIAGFGAIGRAVAARAAGFGMRVVAFRRGDWHADEAACVERAESLASLAAISDHLVLAMPLTAETRHAVEASVLAAAKPGLHLVNVARGGLIDDDALLAALERGTVGFATLDVTDPEPLPPAHAFWTHPRIRLTPHVSWSGGGESAKLTRQILDNLTALAEGRRLADIVDPARGY